MDDGSDVIYVEEMAPDVKIYIIKNSSDLPESMGEDGNDPDSDPPGVYWLPSQEVYFSSAFLDTRYNGSTVRIIGVQHRDQKVKPVCKFRVGRRTISVKTEVHFIYPHWPGKSLYLAAMYFCDTPGTDYDRRSVKVCSHADFACVKIPVFSHNPHAHPGDNTRRMGNAHKKDIAICAKAYNGELEASRLVEWFEMNRLAGVSNVIVYDTGIKGWANHVIKYYKARKFATTVAFPLLAILHDHAVRNFKLSKEEYFSIFQQVYLTSLNDCVMRFLHQYEYFLIIDYDEVLLPVREESVFFMALRHSKKLGRFAGLTFHTAWHFADFEPTYKANKTRDSQARLYLLEHNRRTSISSNQPKSIVLSKPVLSVNWHAVVRVHPQSDYGANTLINSSSSSAYVHHYRGRCVDKFLRATCDVMLAHNDVDKVVPRYGDRLLSRVASSLKALGMRTS